MGEFTNIEKKPSLVKNTLIFLIGNLGSKFISFFMLPFYTYYLATEQYGTYEAVNTSIVLLSAFFGLKLNSAVYRFVLGEEDKEKKEVLLSNAVIGTCFSLVLFVVSILILNYFVEIRYCLYIIVSVIVSVISFLWTFIARAYQCNTAYSVSGIVSTAVLIAVSLFLILFTSLRVEAMLLGVIAAQTTVFCYLEYKLRVLPQIKVGAVSIDCMKRLLRFALPLLPTDIFWWVANLSNRYFIVFFLGAGAAGIFGVAGKLAAFMVMINTVFTLAWLENSILSFHSPGRDDYYSNTFNIYCRFLFSVALILIPLTGLVFRFILNDSYVNALSYTPLLYLGAVFYGFMHFYESVYLSAKDTRTLFYGMLGCGLFNLLCNYFLISGWGLQGASATFFLTYFLLWFFLVVRSKRIVRIRIPVKIFSLLFALSFMVSLPILVGKSNPGTEAIMLSLLVVFFFVLNRKLVSNLRNRLLHSVVLLKSR